MEKGFNLFSALVAATLLIIGTVLISTLVSTEETIGTEVNSMFSNYQLSDAAAIARADALQSFNYSFREQLEDFLTIELDEKNNYTGASILNTEMLEGDVWEQAKREFEKSILLNETGDFELAIKYVAQKTIRQFPKGRYGRYDVYLSKTGPKAEKIVTESLNSALTKGMDEGEKFLEVIDCDELNCEKGSFYFTFPLDKITDEYYEKLPRIVVKDLVTQEEVKFALLPRTRLKIYIPLRFFKGIHESIKNLQFLANFEANKMQKGIKLGFCDIGSCTPRKNPLQSTSGDWKTSNCIGDQSNEIKQDLGLGRRAFGGIHNNYFVDSREVGRQQLAGFVKSSMCKDFSGTVNSGDLNFRNYNVKTGKGLEAFAHQNVQITPCPFLNFDIGADTKPTKIIEGNASKKLYCSKVLQVHASVLYEETNQKNIVTGDKLYYKIIMSTSIMDPVEQREDICSNGGGSCKVTYT